MFQWTPEKKQTALDMAITGKFSLYEIEEKVGASRYYIGLLLKNDEAYIELEKARQPLNAFTENSITELHESGQAPEDIAEACGCTVGEVRRTVLVWEKALEDLEDEDAAVDDYGAGIAHLALLESEHPNRMYEEDVAALTEFAGQGVPMRGRTIPMYLP